MQQRTNFIKNHDDHVYRKTYFETLETTYNENA
jgi:hypothetical protein